MTKMERKCHNWPRPNYFAEGPFGGHGMMGRLMNTTGASPAAALLLLTKLTTLKCLPEGM